MRRRWVRVLVLLVTLAVTAMAVWRAATAEQERGRARQADHQIDATAADAVYALADLRANLHAYVAPDQGLTFWSARAAEQLGRLRTLMADLDAAAADARYPLAAAREALDRLAAAEARARRHVEAGQMLLASDVIFAETEGLVSTVATEVSGLRQAVARAAASRETGAANAQSLLAGGVMALWIVALMLLVPLPRQPAPVLTGMDPAIGSGPLSLDGSDRLGPERTAAEPPQPADPQPAATAAPDLEALATLCTDLGKVANSTELVPVLERAARLMGARGLMLWLAGPDDETLSAAACYGYDPALISRLGAIARDADNLTAAAFRSGQAAVGAATSTMSAAVAVPLPSANGPGGVLAAELEPGRSHNLRHVAAVAGVVAAQLANLFPPPAAHDDAPRSAQA